MRNLILLFILMLSISSCKYLNPSIMLQTDKNFQYSDYKDSTRIADYRISPNDIIEFKMYANDGFRLIDLTTITTGMPAAMREERIYTVEQDGYVKLPIIGRTLIQGYTIRQAEIMLEEKYTEFYIKPFVLLEVVNKRVIIFPGSPGDAKVLTLSNNNTTLMEAIAQAGGISQQGKAWKVKVIRGYSTPAPKVFLADLSTIQGLEMAKMTLQANDIIYIEPRRYVGREVLGELAPVLSIVTSLLITYSLLVNTTN
jgi:polysaccharide biosynthesis/export protein